MLFHLAPQALLQPYHLLQEAFLVIFPQGTLWPRTLSICKSRNFEAGGTIWTVKSTCASRCWLEVPVCQGPCWIHQGGPARQELAPLPASESGKNVESASNTSARSSPVARVRVEQPSACPSAVGELATGQSGLIQALGHEGAPRTDVAVVPRELRAPWGGCGRNETVPQLVNSFIHVFPACYFLSSPTLFKAAAPQAPS